MIHPDIISLSGFAKDSYTYVDGTFTFTDEHFDAEAPGMMKEHSVCISDDLLNAMIVERAAAAGGKKEYEVVKYTSDTTAVVLGTIWGTSITDAYNNLHLKGYSVGPNIAVRLAG
jgi:hypothetical protein